ncbi:hypothetical protein GY45DRAFT_323631 [Cubamyces sp. BRFM 1775]|nr:hypothetical protein GY45DRAFT_323631 [Cubamyces sp. BRFM 1775]
MSHVTMLRSSMSPAHPQAVASSSSSLWPWGLYSPPRSPSTIPRHLRSSQTSRLCTWSRPSVLGSRRLCCYAPSCLTHLGLYVPRSSGFPTRSVPCALRSRDLLCATCHPREGRDATRHSVASPPSAVSGVVSSGVGRGPYLRFKDDECCPSGAGRFPFAHGRSTFDMLYSAFGTFGARRSIFDFRRSL